MLSYSRILAQARSYLAPQPKITPTQWCCENLRFDEPDNHGPFRLSGNHYIREPLDSLADVNVQDRILVFGHQTGKTGLFMGAAAWLCVCVGTRIFWVMPTINLARKFSRTRLMKMLKASKSTRNLIPTGGQSRHSFQILEMEVGQSVIDLTGSNSMANLKSTPARCIFQDEIDEFEMKEDAPNPIKMADGRSTGQANPLKIKASTPKLYEGQAWQFLLQSDLRRRFAPCPHCGKMVILCFDKRYSDLAGIVSIGCEAAVVWDREAKRENGQWDLDRVERSCRHECPFCHGHIRDSHKTLMDRNGEWRPTKESSRGSEGWHLPSFNACSPETTTGKIAVKFLEGKQSLLGVADVVNNYFALPYMAQDSSQKRQERLIERLEIVEAHRPLMTVDCQARAPYFWVVVRQWLPHVSSTGVVATHCDSWEDLEAIQKENKVQDICVMIDSGFGARSDADVYKNCAAHGELIKRLNAKPLHAGWIPSKGQPRNHKWLNKDREMNLPYRLWPIDPYLGSELAGRVEMQLFEFSTPYFQDVLEAMRKDSNRWSVIKEIATDEYWQHIDGDEKVKIVNKKTGFTIYEWQRRNSRWPDHLRLCEVHQLALAAFYELYKLE